LSDTPIDLKELSWELKN